MPVARPGRLLQCAAAVLLACVVLATMQCKRAEEKPSGETLARQYCSGCHEFPDPSVLTKESWRFLLTYMGFYLGQNNFDVLKGSSRSVIENIRSKQMTLQVSGLVPSEPVVSDADWAAIRRYYDSLAPATALPQTGKPVLTDELALFKIKETVYQPHEAIVTMVRVDEPHQQIVVANAHDLDLVILDKQLHVAQKYNGYELLVDMFEHDDSLYVLSIGDLMGRYVGMDRGYVLKVPRNNSVRANALPAAGGLWRRPTWLFTDLDLMTSTSSLFCNFGDVDGSLQLFTLQHGMYKPHSTVVQAPGIVKLCVQDFNKDGLPDLAVLMSHARETSAS
ncbi:MAG: hypothetical protein HC859_16765 [Bacteroidia bacterium]|nr:hypothetical protein [Bacteroidia bacterium]